MKKLYNIGLGVLAGVLFTSFTLASPSGYEEGQMKGSDQGSMKGSAADTVKAPELIAYASATISGTSEEHDLYGEVDLVEMPTGIHVSIEIKGDITPGNHGIHIHEKGSCADAGKGAGGHFNPVGVQHGFLPKDGDAQAHVGDMGNIEIDENGYGVAEVMLPNVSLTKGENNVAGKAIILHAKPDDFGQPTGNAGGRIGCGIINVTE